MATVKEFLDLLCDQVNKGIYVWGGNGENLLTMSDPEAWIVKRETTKANAERDMTLLEQRIAQGVDPIRAFDCSGLVYWSQKQAGYGYSDHTAQGWYKECRSVNKLSEGDLVFHHNGIKCTHVGVYVGDDKVIEAKGRDVGVVETVYSRNAKYWNRQGRLKKMVVPEPIKTTVYVKGGSVRVREGDNVLTCCIGIAHKGDTFDLLGIAANGWYQIDYNGQSAYITNNTKYTELR